MSSQSGDKITMTDAPDAPEQQTEATVATETEDDLPPLLKSPTTEPSSSSPSNESTKVDDSTSEEVSKEAQAMLDLFQ